MMRSRGNHQDVDGQVEPVLDETSAAAADTDEDATPPIWWVKNILSWTLLAAAVALLAALVVVPRLTGSTAYTVLTGSMQPNYPPGTLIVVKPTPGDQLKAGDVITFQPESGNPSVTTHRIVSIVDDIDGNRRFITKGDANNTSDDVQLVEAQIRGRLLYSVPYVGHLNRVLTNSARSIAILAVAVGLGAYALWMWYSSYRDRGKKDEEAPAEGDSSSSRGPGTGPTRPTAQASTSVSGPAAGPLFGPPRPPVSQLGPHSQDFAQPSVGSPEPTTKQFASTCASCGSQTGPSSAITQPIPVIQ